MTINTIEMKTLNDKKRNFCNLIKKIKYKKRSFCYFLSLNFTISVLSISFYKLNLLTFVSKIIRIFNKKSIMIKKFE